MNEEDNLLCCRICLEPDERKRLIAPCSCAGSQKWVHRECLDRWRSTREDRAFSKCTECLRSYTFMPPKDESNVRFWGNIKFYCYCTRDIGLALVFALSITSLIGLIVYQIDRNKSLAAFFGCENILGLFYYGFGLFLSFALIGIFSSFYMCFSGGPRNIESLDCSSCCCCRSRPGDFYYPLYLNPDANCCCCCNDCCGACSPHACDTAACESCTCVACEQEALLIGLVIMAFVGIFVSVIYGVMFVQRVMNSHVHFLHKRTLAQEYIVMDLDNTVECSDRGDIELGLKQHEEISSRSFHEEYPLRGEGMERDGTQRNQFGYLSRNQRDELDRLGLL